MAYLRHIASYIVQNSRILYCLLKLYCTYLRCFSNPLKFSRYSWINDDQRFGFGLSQSAEERRRLFEKKMTQK